MKKISIMLKHDNQSIKIRCSEEENLAESMYDALEEYEDTLFDTDFKYDDTYVKDAFCMLFQDIINKEDELEDVYVDDEDIRLSLSVRNLIYKDTSIQYRLYISKYSKFQSIKKKILTDNQYIDVEMKNI